MAVMIYALTIYQLRARSIRLRTGAPYDDRLGPVSTAPSITSMHPFKCLRHVGSCPGLFES